MNKNLKDMSNNTNITIKDMSVSISYTKTDKLITALYMVTDIIDKEEPLRNKLRTLGTEIISDIHFIPGNAYSKIDQVMSFLSLASTVNIISEMNYNILRKEFALLSESIKTDINKIGTPSRPINLSEFFSHDPSETFKEYSAGGDRYKSIGHQNPTRIGVQKGSTLMQALSDKTNLMSNKNSTHNAKNDFELLKKERRYNIISIIKSKGGSAAIKDIVIEINSPTRGMTPCGEKTLQRELVSMTKDGVLNKTGEKRWSRYSIKN